MLLACGVAMADNTWFEESRNFSAYSLGQGKVHVKVLVFARGGTNNHWATTKNGGSVVSAYIPYRDSIPALFYEGDNKHNCENDYKGWVKFQVKNGTVIVTNPNDGDKARVYTEGSGWVELYLSRTGESNTPTYLEFDWYPPASLDNRSYTLKAWITDTRKSGTTLWTRPWNLGTFSGSDLQAPMLYQPVFYSVGENGQGGFGKVAVPYVVYQEPKSYTTSTTKDTVFTCTERAGQLLVMTTDTVQYEFYANFTIVREDKTTTVVPSSKVNIPAFHRIYDFTAEHYHNATGKCEEGKTTLTWTLKTPWATDIMPTDMFQIQRAYHPDFSDAETMALVPYEQGKGTYEWVDDTEGAMFNPIDSINPTSYYRNPRIYYRVNRVSTTNWGYSDHPWVATTYIDKTNMLPVFDASKCTYRKADDFQETRRILFSLQTEKNFSYSQSYYWDEQATIRLRRRAISAVDTVFIEKVFPGSMMQTLSDSTYGITFEDIADISCCRYEYEVLIDDSQSQLKIWPYWQSRNPLKLNTLDLYYTDAASIATFRVSDGLYTDHILLQWNQTAGSVDSFYVYRSTNIMQQGEEIARLEGQNYYIDTDVAPNTVYYYTLAASYYCGGQRLTQGTRPMVGSLSPYGCIRGRITYPNGTGNAGVTVRAEPSPSSTSEGVRYLYAPRRSRVFNNTQYPVSLSEDFSIQMMVKDSNLTVVRGEGHPLLWSDDGILRLEINKDTTSLPSDSTSRHINYTLRFTMGNETRLLSLNTVNNVFCLTLTYCAHTQTVSIYCDAQQTDSATIPMRILNSKLHFNYAYSRVSSYGVGIDELRIFHRLLSQDDIRTYSRHALAGDESGLILYYKFDMRNLTKFYILNLAKTQSTDGNGLMAANNALIWDSQQYESDYRSILPYGDLFNRFEALTDESGNYVLAGIPFANGITYSVTPTAQHGTFHYNGTSSASATITLGNTRPEATDVDFVNTDAVRFSGRILYERSTIPVKGVHFLVNGVLATDATGNPVETNESGNFQFELPKAPIRVQAVKDGHWFANDGYLILNGDTLFQPTDNIDGIRFYDRTKVRLIGRIAGGNDQGLLPLGFGLSRNNLGDSICMVLELEGDNAAQIVFDPLDKTLNRIDTTIVHAIDTTQHTAISLQSKRIMIYPDQTSGEFFADLFPVKYKVTQLTAQGYSTLTNEKTAMQVIDLTNKLDSQYLSAPNNENYVNNENNEDYASSEKVAFHDTFRHIYHSPITVTPVQSLYGMEVGYFGVERIAVQRWDGESESQSVALAKEDGTYEYLFGKPIFTEGKYTFNIYAHEDYYYNGDRNLGKHDRVMLHEGEVKIYNGMHSNTEVLTGTLDKDGVCRNMVLRADYPTYTRVDEDAARNIQVTVTYERESHTTEPLRVLVFADRREGTEAISSTTADITLYDILRDPPGAGSFATLSAGASYSASKTWALSVKAGVTLEFEKGVKYAGFVGAVTAVPGLLSGQDYNINTTTPFSIPLVYNYSINKDYSYSYSTTETIRTGSDAYHVGANADIFMGAVENLYISTCHGMAVLDSLTYLSMAAQKENGTMRHIATARNPQGELRHLVVAPKLTLDMVQDATFCYTQEHILTTVIPKLVAQRNALVLCVDSAAARAKANQEKKRIYYTTMSPDSADFAITRGKGYDFVDPVNNTGNTPEADEVAGINRAILAWTNLIKQNEKEKVNAQYTTDKKTYSVAGGSTLTYSETVTYGSKYNEMPFNMGGSAGASNLSNIWGSAINKTIQTLLQVGGKADSITIENEAPGSKFSFSLKPIANISTQQTYAASEQKSRTYGYTLSPDPFGYMDVQVMRMKDTISDFYQNAEDTLALTGEKANGTLQSYSSFIFRRLAGASRCPWENADSTLFYQPGTQLNNTTARLENPQITIAQREISNVPADQKAIFQIALSNEQTYDIGYGTKAMTFDLTLTPNCNPNGLKVTIDGQPITTIPMNIRIPHGTTVHKTVEVERGEGYDFENITLKLGSTCDIQSFSLASFSVHFVPAATAVSMPSPHDQWVLNTQSAHDSAGYYIPVSIDGFDIHSDGFDHIELQYKPHTASDADWVNICSYYVSDSLYEQASGTKQRITGSKIDNIRFYGGRDPMEQEYDLRAMAFARYGNGFVTRASEVLHGVKDTRRPELFGTPTPADGILSVGDVLSLRFSEPIAGNLLDEDVNFEVIGTDDVLSLTTSLHFTGESSCYARTKVTRNMNARPFTIEAMIKPTGNAALQTIFALDNEKEPLWFAWAGDHLEAQIGKVRLQSATVEPILDFTRVALTYNPEDSIARFFVGTQEVNYKIKNDEDNENNAKPSYHSAGQLILGNNATYDAPFQGDMLEARLWTKALTQAELARYKDCHLTGYERELVAYYPMNEGKGTTCADKANGATLTLNGTSWVLPEGMSIHLNGAEPICLNGDLLSRSDIEDLTLLFSFKADETLADTSELLHAGKHTMHLTSDALLWRTDSTERCAPGAFADAQWHQLVVAIDRTRNIASLLVDGNTLLATAADDIPAFADSVWTLGQSFRGHIDAFTLFEQALPTYVIERYNNLAPQGDEMGLIAYMPFGQYILQPNGRYELVYSPENARIFRDADGNTVEKHQKLVMNNLTRYTDKKDFAPLRNGNARKKLNFSWASNGDELMININMPDHEINHRHLLLTVQRVEDQHGNAMLSPHTWAAYVHRQQLRWDNPQINYEQQVPGSESQVSSAQPYTFTATIRNHGGTTREYHLNSLPSWLTAQPASGFLAPLETQTITFTVDEGLNIGEYTEYIYLTDDQQLDDRLLLNLHIKATCPWTLDQTELNRSMSLIGQVQIPAENGTIQIDTDSQDMVAAFVGEQCVALAPVRLNQQTKPVTYMTIYGNDSYAGKALRFQLWHAKNGKVYILAPSEDIPFRANECYGCEGTPITLTVTDRQVQQLTLQPGWNWFSLYLKPTYRSDLTRLFCSSDAWTNGDIIKNPEEQYFAEYQMNTSPIRWYGTLSTIRYRSIFLAHVSNPILLQIEGDRLDDEGRTLTLEQGWNVLPYLLTEKQSLTDALADYYDDASEGDLIKSRDAFAVFSHAGKWEGNLTYMQPGLGYMLRRLAPDPCSFTYYTYNQLDQGAITRDAPTVGTDKVQALKEGRSLGRTIDEAESIKVLVSATTMSLIATIEVDERLDLHPLSSTYTLAAYIGNRLVGVGYPQQVGTTTEDAIFFLSIADGAEVASGQWSVAGGQEVSGQIRFVLLCNGEPVAHGTRTLPYQQDTVVGTLRKPYRITFHTIDDMQDKPYKILENQQIYIIRNENKYNILGVH